MMGRVKLDYEVKVKNNKSRKLNSTWRSLGVFGVLLGMTMLVGCVLSNVSVSAVETTTSATASVNVSAACTMTGGPTAGGNTYTDTITPGTSSEYGPTTLTTTCNDPTGFAIYAIGYSGDSYTASNHTKLISTLSSSYDISTNTPSSAGNNSYWAFKLALPSGTLAYPAIIAGSTEDDQKVSGDPDYSTYQAVPDNFTRVAYRTSATDIGTGATGSTVNASYKVGIAENQVADTYTGKVKYTLVHPNSFIAGTYNINFLANGGTGTMPSQTTTSSGTPLYNFEDQTLNALSTGSITPPTGYTFAGWCTVQDNTASGANPTNPNATPQTTCEGSSGSTPAISYPDQGTVLASTVSASSSGSTTTPGTLNLYAYYTLQSFTCNKQYRLQNADGTWGEYISDGSTTTTYGNSCTYTKQITDYKDSATGTNDSAATTTATNVTTNQTLSLDFYRNTYQLTVNKNDTAISSASATTTPVNTPAANEDNAYRWGQSVDITATPNTGYHFTTWSQTAGTTSSFADNTAATTTFTMPKSNATIYADGEASTYTITLNQNGATTASSPTSVNATYNSSTLSSSITNPTKSYSISGFTMGTYADDATVTFPSTGNCTSANNCTYTNTFNGWYDTNATTGGTQIITTAGALTPSNGWTDANSNWTSTSDQTVYARWTAGTSITLPTITKTGYNCGWSESSTASTYTYESGYTGLTLTEDKTLYGICVIKTNLSLKVSFDSNVQSVAVRYGSTSGTLMGTVSTSGNSVSGLTYNSNYYLIPTYKSGYEFNAWTKDAGTVGTLSSTTAANPFYRIGDGSNGVTLASKASCTHTTFSGYMQTISSSTVASACEGDTGTMTDRRDSKIYTVAKINSKLWMTQNLRITGTISSTDSNFTRVSSFNTAAGGDLRGGSATYTAAQSHLADSTDVSSAPSGYTTAMLGAWYNYCAASAGQICSQTQMDATQDICPAGWRLPNNTGNTTGGEIFDLKTALNADSTLKTAWNPIYGGRYNNGSLVNATSYGFWWSSTANYTSSQYSLSYTSGSLNTDSRSRRLGNYIRCILSSS